MERPSLEQIMMTYAAMLSMRSECNRTAPHAHNGCVITNQGFDIVVGFGYNGREIGSKTVCKGDAEGEGNCGCLHAEINAMLNRQTGMAGTVMFTTTAPCAMCARAIVNKKVSKVYYMLEYRDASGMEMLEREGVWTCQVSKIPMLQTLSSFSRNLQESDGT